MREKKPNEDKTKAIHNSYDYNGNQYGVIYSVSDYEDRAF